MQLLMRVNMVAFIEVMMRGKIGRWQMQTEDFGVEVVILQKLK
jgi:hypothetical protein